MSGCAKKSTPSTNNDPGHWIVWSVFLSKSQGSIADTDCRRISTYTSADASVYEYGTPSRALCIGDHAVSINQVVLDQTQRPGSDGCDYTRTGLELASCVSCVLNVAGGGVLPSIVDTVMLPCLDLVVTSPPACSTVHRGADLPVRWNPSSAETVSVSIGDFGFYHSRFKETGNTGHFVIPASWLDSLNSGPITVQVYRVIHDQPQINGVQIISSAFVTFSLELELEGTRYQADSAASSHVHQPQ